MAKADRLVGGGSAERMGLDLGPVRRDELMELLRDEAGLGADDGKGLWVDPHRLLGRLQSVAARLRTAATERQTVLITTGHPVGLSMLYLRIAELVEAGGASVITPANGEHWAERSRAIDARSPSAVGKSLLRR